jgi:hypothetical protein
VENRREKNECIVQIFLDMSSHCVTESGRRKISGNDLEMKTENYRHTHTRSHPWQPHSRVKKVARCRAMSLRIHRSKIIFITRVTIKFRDIKLPFIIRMLSHLTPSSILRVVVCVCVFHAHGLGKINRVCSLLQSWKSSGVFGDFLEGFLVEMDVKCEMS